MATTSKGIDLYKMKKMYSNCYGIYRRHWTYFWWVHTGLVFSSKVHAEREAAILNGLWDKLLDKH